MKNIKNSSVMDKGAGGVGRTQKATVHMTGAHGEFQLTDIEASRVAVKRGKKRLHELNKQEETQLEDNTLVLCVDRASNFLRLYFSPKPRREARFTCCGCLTRQLVVGSKMLPAGRVCAICLEKSNGFKIH